MEPGSFFGTVGTIAGLVVALAIFLFAARFVTNARKGTREVRERRHDPHADPSARREQDQGRDIEQ
jgi:hypothetical protein